MDERSARIISTLHPKAQPVFTRLLEAGKTIALLHGADYVAISGHRSYAEQTELYAKGRTKPGRIVTNARAGYSNHNFGIAVDFGVFKDGKYLDSAKPALANKIHKQVAEWAAKHEWIIEWGGNWKSFQDIPHFQLKGHTLAQLRTLVKEGKWS